MMEFTRNHYYLMGLVLFLLGIQFRAVDEVALTPEFTQFLAERTGHPLAAVSANVQTLTQSDKPPVSKRIRPPDWLGWSFLSIGSVLILHSWAMRKPEG
jgi:hypothetical protein